MSNVDRMPDHEKLPERVVDALDATRRTLESGAPAVGADGTSATDELERALADLESDRSLAVAHGRRKTQVVVVGEDYVCAACDELVPCSMIHRLAHKYNVL